MLKQCRDMHVLVSSNNVAPAGSWLKMTEETHQKKARVDKEAEPTPSAMEGHKRQVLKNFEKKEAEESTYSLKKASEKKEKENEVSDAPDWGTAQDETAGIGIWSGEIFPADGSHIVGRERRPSPKAGEKKMPKRKADGTWIAVKKKEEKSAVEEKQRMARKTQWCKYFNDQGRCDRGERCLFAHGEEELGSWVVIHDKKTMCHFWATGCRNGNGCDFFHGSVLQHAQATWRTRSPTRRSPGSRRSPRRENHSEKKRSRSPIPRRKQAITLLPATNTPPTESVEEERQDADKKKKEEAQKICDDFDQRDADKKKKEQKKDASRRRGEALSGSSRSEEIRLKENLTYQQQDVK